MGIHTLLNTPGSQQRTRSSGGSRVNYKLSYFNVRWLGEPARGMFAQAGQQYTDVRVSQEEWPVKYKPNMPFGTLPVLEVDGQQLAQSTAIYRFLARELGLCGKDDFAQAQCDAISDYVQDFIKPIGKMGFGEEDSMKAAAKKFVEEDYPTFLGNFEKILTENGGGDGFFVGDSVTWADLVFISFLDVLVDNFDMVKERSGGVMLTLDDYPKVKALRDRVRALPAISAWINARRKTDVNFYTSSYSLFKVLVFCFVNIAHM